MRVNQVPAFVLHRRPYSETSLLIDIFSREYGRLMLLAKGARRIKSRHRGLIRPFVPLLLSWSGKGELQILTGVELVERFQNLTGQSLLCGFYMNELLMRLLHRHDPHENLFDTYKDTVNQLKDKKDFDTLLRLFEKNLLREIGYAMVLDEEVAGHTPVEASRKYVYTIGQGPKEATATVRANDLLVSGQTLLALSRNQITDGVTKRESKRLTRALLDRYLDGKPLVSRRLFTEVSRGS